MNFEIWNTYSMYGSYLLCSSDLPNNVLDSSQLLQITCVLKGFSATSQIFFFKPSLNLKEKSCIYFLHLVFPD